MVDTVEVLDSEVLAVKVALAVKVTVGEPERVGEVLLTPEPLSCAEALGEPELEEEPVTEGEAEGQLLALDDCESVGVKVSLTVTVGEAVPEVEALPLGVYVPLPGLTLAEEVTEAVAQAVAVCDTDPEPPPAVVMVRDTEGDIDFEALTVPLLAALMEGDTVSVPLWGLALAEREGERVAVWQGEAEREAVGVTVPVAVPLRGVAVGELEGVALVQCVGEAVALPVTVLPPVKVALALSEAREEMEALKVAECVALVEAVVEGLPDTVPTAVTVPVAAPESVGEWLALAEREEEALAVAVVERVRVGEAVELSVEKLPAEAEATRLAVTRRLPVATWQAVAGAEGVKLEEVEASPETEAAAEAERVKVGLTEGAVVREAVAQAVDVAEALVVSVARALAEGLRGVPELHPVVVGDTEAVREGEEDTLGEEVPVGAAPVGVVEEVALPVTMLALVVGVVEGQGE